MKETTKKHLSLILRIIVAVVLLAYLFVKIDIMDVWDKLKNAQIGLMITAILLYAIICVMAIIRWNLLLLVHKVRVSYMRLTELFFIGLFFNNAMPGSTGGDIIKAYYTAKETKTHKPEAVTTVFIDRIVGIIGLLTIGLFALMFNLKNPAFQNIAIFLLCLFVTMIIFTPLFLSKNLMKKVPLLQHLIEKLPFGDMIKRIYHTFYTYKSHKKTIVYGILLSMGLQAIFIVAIAIMGQSIGMELKLHYYFLFIPIIATIAALPVSVSGLGVNESLYVYCFSLVGATEESSLAIALLGRLILMIWSIPGWYFYMTAGKNKLSEQEIQQEIKGFQL
ncbi:MAG: lysylphosphatidylglycerol synthase transmembrane domain-containing protein [Candidatus Auribacterota bacterium]|jgi:uncharacterized protein (TIRG00374 family)|nr:lysylphosphatidylglycerol synthase transmembrane domain-containing protein [Candidatus Auribacterota bacterium]